MDGYSSLLCKIIHYARKCLPLKPFSERISGLPLSTMITSKESGFDGEELAKDLTPYLKQIGLLSLTVPDDTFLAFADLQLDSCAHLKSSFSSLICRRSGCSLHQTCTRDIRRWVGKSVDTVNALLSQFARRDYNIE